MNIKPTMNDDYDDSAMHSDDVGWSKTWALSVSSSLIVFLALQNAPHTISESWRDAGEEKKKGKPQSMSSCARYQARTWIDINQSAHSAELSKLTCVMLCCAVCDYKSLSRWWFCCSSLSTLGAWLFLYFAASTWQQLFKSSTTAHNNMT